MNYPKQEYKHQETTQWIIKAFYNVYNTLGTSGIKKIRIESSCAGSRIKVYYDNEAVGDYFADIIVNDVVIIEIKAMEALCEEHEAQLLNYLRATDIEVGLLLNFGKKPQLKRRAWTN